MEESNLKSRENNVLRMPEDLIADMNAHLPGRLTIKDIQTLRMGKGLAVCFICNDALMKTPVSDMLDLSVRSTNALKRSGFMTVGDLIETENSFEHLTRIRHCGAKSRAEIMGKLFFYQYSIIPEDKRSDYMKKILKLNGIVKKVIT